VAGEIAIRLAVNELKIWAEQTEFSLLEQKVNNKAIWLIRDWKELFTKVSDQQTVVSSLQDTPYFAPFADQCLQLQAKLVLLDECLHALNSVQRKWVYLAPIFGRGALPSEQPR
jgi:dynein heavy chain 2